MYMYMYISICIYIYILYTHIYIHTPFAFVMFTLLGVSNISYLNPQLTTERSPQAIQVPTHSQKALRQKSKAWPHESALRVPTAAAASDSLVPGKGHASM